MELWETWSSGRCPCSLQAGWTRWPLKVPSNPNHSMILCFLGNLWSTSLHQLSTQFLSQLAWNRNDPEPCPVPCIAEPHWTEKVLFSPKTCKRWRYFRGEGSGTVVWYHTDLLICRYQVSTTLLLNLLKKGSVSLERTSGDSSCPSFTVSPVSQPTGFSSVTKSLDFMMDTASCHGICSSPKPPWVKDSLTRPSHILLLLSPNPWSQTRSSSMPALCRQAGRAATTCRSGRWKQSTSRCSRSGQKSHGKSTTPDQAEPPGQRLPDMGKARGSQTIIWGEIYYRYRQRYFHDTGIPPISDLRNMLFSPLQKQNPPWTTSFLLHTKLWVLCWNCNQTSASHPKMTGSSSVKNWQNFCVCVTPYWS